LRYKRPTLCDPDVKQVSKINNLDPGRQIWLI
jgi:hypothetical protein